MQSRWQSFNESAWQVGIGFFISYWAGTVIYPLVGHDVTHLENLVVTILFTIVSLARQYIIRRWFNRR